MSDSSKPKRCPDCGLIIDPERHTAAYKHRCGVPILARAIGLELTDQEKRFVRYLAAGFDQETVDAFASLFLRVRRSAAAPLRRRLEKLDEMIGRLGDGAKLTEEMYTSLCDAIHGVGADAS